MVEASEVLHTRTKKAYLGPRKGSTSPFLLALAFSRSTENDRGDGLSALTKNDGVLE